MKIHLLVLPVLVALFAAGASSAQLYVPLPPGNRDLILTNVGTKPAVFRSTLYLPRWPPLPLDLETLDAGHTAINTGGTTFAGFDVIEVLNSGWQGLHVSAAIVGDQSAFRLPVFTSRDVAPPRRPITFQFSPQLQPHETAALVVLSVTESRPYYCSVSLHNDSGVVSRSSFTVPAYSQIAVVNLVPPVSVTYVRASCSKPSLAYGYRVTATTTEFLSPSVSQ
jgi:hypothetical protein